MDEQDEESIIPEEIGEIKEQHELAHVGGSELLQRAAAANDLFMEARYAAAHEALADLIETATELMNGCVKTDSQLELAKKRGDDYKVFPSPYALQSYYSEGSLDEAHDELRELLDSCVSFARRFDLVPASGQPADRGA